jgi:ABC-type amino acid transport substrate-binding protein
MVIKLFLQRCCVLFFLLLAISSAQASERPMLTFNCPRSVGQSDFDFANQVYSEVFSPMGYDFRFVYLARRDAVKQLAQGQLDGDCARAPNFLELTGLTNLIRIETPLRTAAFETWYRDEIESNTPYKDIHLGYNGSTLFLKKNLEIMGFGKLTSFDDYQSLADALVNGEIDALFNYEEAIAPYKKALHEQGAYLADTPIVFPVHTYVSEKYATLVPEIESKMNRYLKYNPYYPPIVPPVRVIDKSLEHKPSILFSCILQSKSFVFMNLYDIYSQIFKTLGYNFHMVSMNLPREAIEFGQGNVDGSCGLPSGLGAKLIGAKQVNAVVGTNKIKIWGLKAMPELRQLSDIPAGAKVAVIRGGHISREILQAQGLKVTVVNSVVSGLKMLNASRIDFFIGSSIGAKRVFQKIELRQPVFTVGYLRQDNITPFLSHKNSHLSESMAIELNRYFTDTRNRHKLEVLDLLDIY